MRKEYPVTDISGEQWVYLDSATDGEVRLGVSLSGGGSRSASFSTGVMQRLIKDEIFERITHLAAISGGTYTAGGMSVTVGESDEKSIDGPPWQNGSDEEAHLRLSTTFLSSGPKDMFWLVANVIYGFILNYTPIGLSFFVIGRLYGLLIGSLSFSIDGKRYTDLDFEDWLSIFSIPILFMILVCIALVAVRRFMDRAKLQASDSFSEKLVSLNYVSGLLLLAIIFLVLSPSIILSSRDYVDITIQWMRVAKLGFSPGITQAIGTVILMILVAVIGFLLIGLASRFPRLGMLRIPASLAGPLILILPFSAAAYTSIYIETTLDEQLPLLSAAVFVIFVFGLFIHNRRYSLHLFYRERLQRSFVFKKKQVNNEDDATIAELPYSKQLSLSAFSSEALSKYGFRFPNVIYCAAVAANRTKAPYRRNAGSYTFESDWCGGPLTGYVRTKLLEFEYSKGGTALTIPSLMAISGAAVSPFMGRFGGGALRFMLAVLNLRLGVWIPHRKAFLRQKNMEYNRLKNNSNKAQDKATASSEIDRRTNDDVMGGWYDSVIGERSSIFQKLMQGWWEPGGLYVIFEALGIARTNDNYSFVSDGGHWENLGIVELLRRRCNYIIVVDSSAVETDLSDELSRSVRLANSELGVEVDFDVDSLKALRHGEKHSPPVPYATGVFTYPDGEKGYLFFLRCTLWESAPFELASLSRVDKQFPHHPTFNQYLSGEQFDGYRRLGWAAAGYIKSEWPLPVDPDTAKPKQTVESSILY